MLKSYTPCLQVVPKHAADFRRRIEKLFPQPLQENTLHTTFRRAGLVPDRWASGWSGIAPFIYDQAKRQSYAPPKTTDKAASVCKLT